MGGGDVPKAESMGSVLNAYSQYLPGLLQTTSAQLPGIAQNQFNATAASQPLYNALNLQQAQNYAVPLAQVGQDVTRSNALAGGETNYQQITGSGGQAALAANALARISNPEYYSTLNNATRQSNNLLNSINLGGLSGGEQSAVERSLARDQIGSGNLGLNNATNTVSNAMNFGGAFNSKLGTLGQALGSSNQTANTAQNTGFNPVNIALGQPNASTMGNFGTGTFSNTNASTQNNAAGNAFNFGSSMLGGMQGANNAAIGANASISNANSAPAYMNATGSILSGL